jgi:hypothetical protein
MQYLPQTARLLRSAQKELQYINSFLSDNRVDTALHHVLHFMIYKTGCDCRYRGRIWIRKERHFDEEYRVNKLVMKDASTNTGNIRKLTVSFLRTINHFDSEGISVYRDRSSLARNASRTSEMLVSYRITTHKTSTWIFTAVKIWNLASLKYCSGVESLGMCEAWKETDVIQGRFLCEKTWCSHVFC